MCDACDETPDGRGRRCNRPDGRMTSTEKDQRNRSRNLANARDALAQGDAQGAANSLASALAAQRALDGGPSAPVGEPSTTDAPHRDFVVAPSDVATAMARVQFINSQRDQKGLPPVTMDVTRQHQPTSDPIMAMEQATVRISGASQEELDSLTLGNVRTEPERRVNTKAVLEAACAATRLNGGRYVATSESANSIPAQINAFVNDVPGGPERTRLATTPEDKKMAVQVRSWVRTQQPTTDYLRALRHSVSEEYMGLREAGTASSAIAGFQRHRQRIADMEAQQAREQAEARAQNRPVSQEPVVVSPRPGGSRWLGQKGQDVTVVANVEGVYPMMHEARRKPHYLYIMRTPDGDLVRWMATNGQGLEVGDHITLQGTIKGHSTFNGEKQTEMFYCKPLIHTT